MVAFCSKIILKLKKANDMLKKYIKNNVLREVIEWTATIAAAIIIGFLFSNFVVGRANVYGESMMPTIHQSDVVLLNKFVYRFTKPKRNDIIVFPFKGQPENKYIKRVIGLPGDVIDFSDGYLFVNGERLDDDFSDETKPGSIEYPHEVPENCYFVLGDNRNHSNDSRAKEVGDVPAKIIIGKAFIRVLPINKINLIR